MQPMYQLLLLHTVAGAVVSTEQLQQLCGLGRHLAYQHLAVVLQVLLCLQHKQRQPPYQAVPQSTAGWRSYDFFDNCCFFKELFWQVCLLQKTVIINE